MTQIATNHSKTNHQSKSFQIRGNHSDTASPLQINDLNQTTRDTKASMSAAQVWHKDPRGKTEYFVIDGDLLAAHSDFFRRIKNALGLKTVYKVWVVGDTAPTWEATKMVLQEINSLKPGKILNISTSHLGPSLAIQLHRAICYLRIEPVQDHEGHIKGFLSRQLVSPKEMHEVHTYYGNPTHTHHSIWSTMIHHIAFTWVHGGMTQAKKDALKTAASAHADLQNALVAKVTELRGIKKGRDKRDATREGKAPAQPADWW